ncbi:hypothetical protein QL285_093205 [Trifolium repens]|nr:hypothetical protein QL285_093205 [Trifolium repens]
MFGSVFSGRAGWKSARQCCSYHYYSSNPSKAIAAAATSQRVTNRNISGRSRSIFSVLLLMEVLTEQAKECLKLKFSRGSPSSLLSLFDF